MKSSIPGRFNYANAHDMYRYLGTTRLPDEGMSERLVHGVRVYVKPLPPLESIAGTRRRRRFALRVMAICTCGRHVPVGRLHQHKCKAPVLNILARKPRSSDSELILVDRGLPNCHRYVVGTATAHSLASGEWFWGHYYATLQEAQDYFDGKTTDPSPAPFQIAKDGAL